MKNLAQEALRPFEHDDGENPYTVQRDLQEMMQHNVGIVRDEERNAIRPRTFENVLGTSARRSA